MLQARRVLAAGSILAGSVVLAAGCGPGAAQPPVPASTSPVTFELPAETVRPSETALRMSPTSDGDTSFALIGLTVGLPSLVGSHAEMPAKGRYTRIRLVVTNTGRSTTKFDPTRQQLVTADGQAYQPDTHAMLIKRQPGAFDLGAGVRVEFDLYYDIAPEARPATLRVFGGSTLTDPKDETGTEIKLG